MAQTPEWRPLDGGISLPDAPSSGRIVALVASERAVEKGWAGSAALDLARAWSAEGEKVILVDGALHYPTLHQDAGVDNFEGLSDAAHFGVSIGRVARPIDDGAFFLITAGTAVANANSVPGSGRWGRLLEGFLEAGVRLLLFVRDGDSGCAAFLGSASDIVVLAERGEAVPGAVRDLEPLVRAVTGPGVAPGVALGEGSSEPGVRPPAEWTAEGPGGKRRIKMLALWVVFVVAVLVAAVLSIDFSAFFGG